MSCEVPLATAVAERIGEPHGLLTFTRQDASGRQEQAESMSICDHAEALHRIVESLTDPDKGVIRDKAEISAVGHRVVHGGERFQLPVLVDEEVIRAIRENSRLAPLHNPSNLTGIEIARLVFPESPQVAVFDTAFHQTMPPKAFLYAIPYEFYEEHGIRRYGFHGTSHAYVAEAAAEFLGQPLDELTLITAHLGNGASMAAIRGGCCIDSTMGLTPLAGLMMGTRPGDIDPGLPGFLVEHLNLTFKEVGHILNHESGLKGICGTNDMREIVRREANGDQNAKLALEMYAYRFKKHLGALFGVLGSLDALVLTAGIGENVPRMRELCCSGLAHFGIVLDEELNQERSGIVAEISSAASLVRVLVVPTNEELMIARETMKVLVA